MNIKIKDKVALITGGARGIGLSTAKNFLDAEAKIFICDNNEYELKITTDNLQSSYGDRIHGILADVSIEEDVKRMVNSALQEYSTIDILVNNAGISGMNYIWDMPAEEWDAVFNVNLRGAFVFSRGVL